ncbi:MAG: hypothetical protein ACO1NQ_14185 [Flavobacteriales bacterium]
MNERAAPPPLVDAWFQGQGFMQVHFSGPSERITTFHMGHSVVFDFRQRAHHRTFYKEAAGGSLIVFEVTTKDGKVQYTGYCPVLLFGIWEWKLSFKADAGSLAPYRKEGFEVAQGFKRLLEERGL